MANAQDIAKTLLASTLNTGLHPDVHGQLLADWANAQTFDQGEGCPFDEAVRVVSRIVCPQLHTFLGDVVFAAACRMLGDSGRAFDRARDLHLAA